MSLTITANLKDLTNTANVGWAIFQLVGYGADVPRISGTALLSSLSVKATADGSGAISQAIIGNDVITPAGTSYVVFIYSSTGALISVARYKFTGSGSIDLSSQTPL